MENRNIADLIKAAGFRFNKALGQNFIFDTNLLDAIVTDSGVTEDDTVVEVGTGAGTLTSRLALRAKRFILSKSTKICKAYCRFLCKVLTTSKSFSATY